MARRAFCIPPALGALAIVALGSPTALPGQTSPEPTLDYGVHGVGFTVVEALDSTRAFRPLRNFRGELAAETARPVQVSLWYPAHVSARAPRMRAGEFRLLTETEVDFDPGRASPGAGPGRSRFIAQAVRFGQDPATAARTWDAVTPAVRDAAPVPGRHPTVLYMTAAGVSNPLLPAYLASHGFVVASFPSNGRMTEGTLEFTPNALTLDTDIDDAGFVHSLLRGLPYADTRRLAVASFSAGSLAALLWAMRDMQVTAIVAVEGWERYRRGADIISGSVHYEPHRVRVPLLMVERAADETSPQYAKVPDVVGALPYADITRVAFRDAAHADFLSHIPFGHTPQHGEIYETSAVLIRRFLQASIGGDNAALQVVVSDDHDPSFTVVRQLPVGRVPTEEELYRLAETDATAAEAAYRDARRIVPGATLFRRGVLTRAARYAATAEDSATIMRIVEDAYPDSSSGGRGSSGAPDSESALVAAARQVGAFLRGNAAFDEGLFADTVVLHVAPEGGGAQRAVPASELAARSGWTVGGYSLVPPSDDRELVTAVGRHLSCMEAPLATQSEALARLPHVGTALRPPEGGSCLQSWTLTLVFDATGGAPRVVAALYDQWEW